MMLKIVLFKSGEDQIRNDIESITSLKKSYIKNQTLPSLLQFSDQPSVRRSLLKSVFGIFEREVLHSCQSACRRPFKKRKY